MAPTTIYFNGRLFSKPGSYSNVDPRGLESPGLTASGIVALIGTAIGGKPYSAVNVSKTIKDQLQVATGPGKPYDFFKSGDLLEAGLMMYSASNDDQINGSPQEVVFVKVNPSVASSYTFSDVGGDLVKVTARDYGYFTNQIVVEIGTGTTQGKIITVTYEDIEEVFDDVGGGNVFTLTFAATVPANGYTAVECTTYASNLAVGFSLQRAGKASDITNQVATGLGFELLSSNAGDGQTVTVYGRSATNVGQSETLTVNGTSVVTSTKTWNSIAGAMISASPTGTVTLRNLSAGTTICTLTSANQTRGLYELSDVTVARETVTMFQSAAGTPYALLIGKNQAGVSVIEAKQLNGTSNVDSVGSFSSLEWLALGEISAATYSLGGRAFILYYAGTDTLRKVSDIINGKPGFTLTTVTDNPDFKMVDMDIQGSQSIKSPAVASFTADLYEFINKINTSSALISAERQAGAANVPSNTLVPVYLAGGHEGDPTAGNEGIPTATATDWQNCLDLLSKVFVNSIGVLSPTPAIHAKLAAHLQYMCTVGKMERDGAVGLMNAALDGLPTKSEIKSQITALNTKNIRAWGMDIERYNAAGEIQTFEPQFGAAMLLAMQASTPVATSLTRKTMNVLSIESDPSWNPADDAEEMISYGLCFAEAIDGVGHKIVRNITTHKSTSNIAYVEASANEAVNYSTYNIRTALEFIVGRSGFRGSANVVKAEAEAMCGKLLDVSLSAYRSPAVELVLDVIGVELSLAPVLPINFVKTNIHLISVAQVAA